jgi:hypothetical protein
MPDPQEQSVLEIAKDLLGEPVLAASAFKAQSLLSHTGAELFVLLARSPRRLVRRRLTGLPKPFYLAVTENQVGIFAFTYGLVASIHGPVRLWPRSQVSVPERSGDGSGSSWLRVGPGPQWCEILAVSSDDHASSVLDILGPA